jgi:hypothetical protein
MIKVKANARREEIFAVGEIRTSHVLRIMKRLSGPK